MQKIILNHKSLLSKKTNFFGRAEEISQVLSALNNQKGSTTLVSGDRGSGKTTLIDETVQTLKDQLRNSLFFNIILPDKKFIPSRLRGGKFIPKRARYTSVVVKVPLIPPNTEAQMVKGIVLRAIIHTLSVDRPIGSYFLYPIMYRYHLRKLKKMINYKQRSVERGFNLGGSAKGVEATFNQVYKSELDLSDIRIELELANFFRKFADKIRFVIIFDETDKYEDTSTGGGKSSLTPKDLIYNTKNLFTTNGAHFIFVSTEDYYYGLVGEIRSNKRDASHTLFSNTVLINHLSPDAFLKSLRTKISNYSTLKDAQEYQQFEQAMMWSSGLYPFEQNKQLAELTGSDGQQINIEDAEDYYSECWETHAALHLMVSTIYDNQKKNKDSYYNRYLYRVLREVVMFLLESTQLGPINRRNLIGTIFYNDIFMTPEGRTEFLEAICSRNSQPDTQSTDWRHRIYELSASELDRIEDAVEDLIWSLDRMGYISVIRDSSWRTPITLNVKFRSLSFKSIDKTYPNIEVRTNKESKLLSKYQLSYTRYKNINGSVSVSAPNIGAADARQRAGKWIASLSANCHRFTADIDQELEILKAYDIDMKHHILKSIHAWLAPYNLPILDLQDGVLSVEDDSGKKMVILNDPKSGATKTAVNAKKKVIVIHKFASRYAKEIRSPYLRKFQVLTDFTGYQQTLSASKRAIKEYFGI